MKTQIIRAVWIDRFLVGIGLMLLSLSAGAWIYGSVDSRVGIGVFEANQERVSAVNPIPKGDSVSSFRLDPVFWSSQLRKSAYEDSLENRTDQPRAILRIPKIHLKVPVYNNTDDLTRGVGRIVGTAQIGGSGNLGIAGHRDSFFRGLKDLALHEEIDLDRISGSDTYEIEKIQIVSPEDVSVLAPGSAPTLTLVTCFPFYFVGSAPKRYIVTASLTNSSHGYNRATEDFNSTGSKGNKKENGK